MKIKNSSLSLKQKINKVTRFVQDEIRYVGVEIGDRGYRPKDPNIVYEDGLGDCKDKSKLLVAILRKLGIKSSIALVNTESDIKTTLPGPYAFNHAIVNYIFDGINYWIDPTISIQRGKFGEIHIPHYKNALVLNKKTKDIIKINSHSQRAYGFDISINEHLVSKSVRESVDYIIEKTYKNQEANKIRRWVIDKGIDKVEKQFFNSALKNYPKLKKIRNIQMFDDQKNNIFKFIEHYEISHFWPLTGGHWKASFNIFSTFQDYLILPHNQKRKMPLKIGERTSLKHRFELRLHKKHDFVVNQVDFTHEVFDFSVGQDYSGNTFIFDATLKMNKDIVDPQEINSYIKKVNSIRGELFRYIKIKNEDSLFSTFKKIFKN
jgi:hypothetical protein